ncbi:response regulator [Azospirillum sp. SYSU D00513]|uniref:response regulator n=1 Tax=Azospirillum sp. SYSU D00513 TaxID=2812561 RepID=UPI001A95BF50|nr:response regulator [Azospirillum sp. SYSU D00513]
MGLAILATQSMAGKGGLGTLVSGEPGGTLATRRLRLLVVEDEAIPALLMEQTLTALGYEVCDIADSESSALQAVEQHRPDLILMDIRLAEGSDGIDTATKARTHYGVPSLFMTAHSDPATRARAESAKPLGFLLKPYSREQVQETLARAVERLGEN